VITLAAFALQVSFGLGYWSWMGYVIQGSRGWRRSRGRIAARSLIDGSS
jgi:hypothetical protein